MTRLIKTLTTTFRNLKLLSDPQLYHVIEGMNIYKEEISKPIKKLGKADLYYHKYFMVQILD